VIQRLTLVVIDGETRAYWRRREGVGELTGDPAIIGEVRSDVVEDDGSPGTGGVAGGGANLLLLLRWLHGLRR
jgi:hypothetical protein